MAFTQSFMSFLLGKAVFRTVHRQGGKGQETGDFGSGTISAYEELLCRRKAVIWVL